MQRAAPWRASAVLRHGIRAAVRESAEIQSVSSEAVAAQRCRELADAGAGP